MAIGALDVYQADNLQCWDYAAGVVIVREAGGSVLNTDGKLSILIISHPIQIKLQLL